MSIVEKQLSRGRENSVNDTKESVKKIQLLLEGDAIEERKILAEAGLDFNIKKVETQVGVNLVREKKEEQLNAKVFTEAEIKETCIKYNLRFLHSRKYKGSIEPTLGSAILNFFKEKNIDSKSYEAANNLFIMAPSKAFNLEERPKPAPIDPVMFYKMSTTEGDMYALVHKWGKDFTVFRRLLGAAKESSWNWYWTMIILSFVSLTIGTACIGFNPFGLMTLLINTCIAFGGVLVYLLITVGDGSSSWERYRKSFSRESWNSIYH